MSVLAFTLAVQAIEEQSAVVRDLQAQLIDATAQRNQIIIDARAVGLPYSAIQKATVLSRETLVRIVSAHRRVSA